MGAIMHKDPDWSALPLNTPPTIQLLLRRCLTKDRKRRLHDIADARIEVENAIVDPASTSLGLARAALEVRHRWLPPWPVTIAFVIIVVLTAVSVWFAKPQASDSPPVVRCSAIVPAGQELANSRFPIAAISPDASQLAYVATTEGVSQLYLRRMDQQSAIALGNTTNAESPVFSLDGRWIAFAQKGKLKRVSVLGGPALTISEAAQLRGVDWGVNNMLAYAPRRRSGIWIVLATGGKPEQLTNLGPDSDLASHRWPHFLPDGRTVLFTHTDNEDAYSAARIEAVSLDTRERKVLIRGATDARYVPTGHLVFVRGDVLMAVAFDPRQVEITGSEVPVLETLTIDRSTGSGQYSFSDNGVLVYFSGGEMQGISELVWVDRAGKTTAVSQHARRAMTHALSPDGSRIAWALGGGTIGPPDIWLLEIERDMLTRLTFDDSSEAGPVWSPDSLWVYFYSDRAGGIAEIYRRKADGSGDAERLTTANNSQFPWSVSPDGRTVAFLESRQTGNTIMLLHLEEERAAEAFLTTRFDQDAPAVSPDGTLIAYTSEETGIEEVYVRQFPSGAWQVKISLGLATYPKWSPDGTELFYTNSSGEFYSVSIDVKDGVLSPGGPKLMFELRDSSYAERFDVAPDGQRFLISRTQDSKTSGRQHPTLVVNWFAELKQKMATVKDR
jgi:Tol biopolymer transport system component